MSDSEAKDNDSRTSDSEDKSNTQPSLPPELNKHNDVFKTFKQKGLEHARWVGLAILIIISVGFGFLGGWLGYDAHNSSLVSPIQSKQVVLSNEGKVINQIAKSVGPSVVSVTATQDSSASPFGAIFGLNNNSGSSTQQDEGTGIVLSADGLIITNRHVVPDGTTSVSVTLSDGTQYNNVQIVGRTSSSDSLDIAFLKINNLNGRQLTPAIIGDSSQMKVGDPVVAIGNALGQFQNTVTNGIISGYGRNVQASDGTGSSSESLDDLFQTDAAINEGNSGGPLVNLSGQVIGINTAIASNAQNIGFAIPINDVTGLIQSVEKTGKLQRPYLGVIYIPVTNDLAQQYNLSVNRGAWVPPQGVIGQSPIIAGGPADKAGLQPGDIITQVNGVNINENQSLTSILDKKQVGQKVTLTVVRNGKTIKITATLGAAPTS